MVAASALVATTAWCQNADDNPYGLPIGVHPHLKSLIGDDDAPEQGVDSEIKYIGHQIKTTVKSVTAKRRFSCFGEPCNIKAFPLMYNRRYSGFWGGARAKLTNDTRNDPYLYAIDLNFQRSDTQQSDVGIGLDVPRLLMLPYQPRFKMDFGATNTNEVRFFGTGATGEYYDRHHDKLDQTRYDLKQVQIESLLSFRIAVIQEQTYSIFGGFHTAGFDTGHFRDITNELFVDKPTGYKGGVAGAWTLGIASDSRDSEFMARQGWMLEGGVSVGGMPIGNYKFTRFFMNDRRFFSYKKSTLAHRLTFDVINGNAPFWELKRVEGTQSINDVSSSDILRAYYRGRFHETFKLIESLEWRYYTGKVWFFGLKPELITVPMALNFGKLGDMGAWSASSGAYLAFSKSFLAQIFTGYAPTGWDLSLLFGVNI